MPRVRLFRNCLGSSQVLFATTCRTPVHWTCAVFLFSEVTCIICPFHCIMHTNRSHENYDFPGTQKWKHENHTHLRGFLWFVAMSDCPLSLGICCMGTKCLGPTSHRLSLPAGFLVAFGKRPFETVEDFRLSGKPMQAILKRLRCLGFSRVLTCGHLKVCLDEIV